MNAALIRGFEEAEGSSLQRIQPKSRQWKAH
jgi:hypothetical protein